LELSMRCKIEDVSDRRIGDAETVVIVYVRRMLDSGRSERGVAAGLSSPSSSLSCGGLAESTDFRSETDTCVLVMIGAFVSFWVLIHLWDWYGKLLVLIKIAAVERLFKAKQVLRERSPMTWRTWRLAIS